jgi:hypothetical protein
MARGSEGNRATVTELLDRAAKLEKLANEIERTGRGIGDAAAGAAALNGGFTVAVESVATCGHLNRCVAKTVADMRAQVAYLRRTAAEYTDMARRGQTQVTLAGGSSPA